MEHNDPGMDNLDKILGVLNEVEYKLKEMKGSQEEENREATKTAQSYFTKCREEVKKMVGKPILCL